MFSRWLKTDRTIEAKYWVLLNKKYLKKVVLAYKPSKFNDDMLLILLLELSSFVFWMPDSWQTKEQLVYSSKGSTVFRCLFVFSFSLFHVRIHNVQSASKKIKFKAGIVCLRRSSNRK